MLKINHRKYKTPQIFTISMQYSTKALMRKQTFCNNGLKCFYNKQMQIRSQTPEYTHHSKSLRSDTYMAALLENPYNFWIGPGHSNDACQNFMPFRTLFCKLQLLCRMRNPNMSITNRYGFY